MGGRGASRRSGGGGLSIELQDKKRRGSGGRRKAARVKTETYAIGTNAPFLRPGASEPDQGNNEG